MSELESLTPILTLAEEAVVRFNPMLARDDDEDFDDEEDLDDEDFDDDDFDDEEDLDDEDFDDDDFDDDEDLEEDELEDRHELVISSIFEGTQVPSVW